MLHEQMQQHSYWCYAGEMAEATFVLMQKEMHSSESIKQLHITWQYKL
jgi:hypothetical protein